MERIRTSSLSLSIMAAIGLCTAAPSYSKNLENTRLGGTGFVANDLVDQKVAEPIYEAESVFDVYRVIVDLSLIHI